MDLDHLHLIRRSPATFAPGGVGHLILEVLAYAAEEAAATGSGRCAVVLHADGSISVSDDGRGTDTRVDARGRTVKKPIMASKDLRFFDHPGAQLLPNGHPRRGISVVAALSPWLVHTNRRQHGAWTQHYERGVPVTDLLPLPADGTTGTTVGFHADAALPAISARPFDDLARWASSWPALRVDIDDRR